MKRTIFTQKTFVLLAGLLLVVALVVAALELTNKTHFFHAKKTSPETVIPEAKTTSTAPSAQDSFTNGSDRQATSTNKTEGTVKDTGGSVGTVPSSSEWTTSSDGAITVYTPAKSALITNGSTFTGASTHPKVYFRLIDNVSGVIAQGAVNVSSGKYSGTFSFTTKGTQGRLDIFYANADGVESSSISIPVRYK